MSRAAKVAPKPAVKRTHVAAHGKTNENGQDPSNGQVTTNGKATSNAKAAANGSLNGHVDAETNGASAHDWVKGGEWSVVWLDVKDIAPNPYQPRTTFDADEMKDLVVSVKAHGVHQPVTVRTVRPPEEPPKEAQDGATPAEKTAALPYHLVVGERRLRACKAAGRTRIPAILRDDLTDAEVAELALVENVQRARLNPMEAARGYKRLMLEFRMKEERIAKRMGLSVQSIKDAIRLLQLPDSVQKLIVSKTLSATHGQVLVKLAAFPDVCAMVAQHAAANEMTAKALEANPLPNAAALQRKGWIAPLDFRTEFNWKTECGNCPYGAYVTSQFSAFCLKPLEFKAKNNAAAELKKQESRRIMEEVRQNESNTVEAESLPRLQYRNLSNGAPTGCSEGCACRRQIRDPDDQTKTIPICIDLNRHGELVQAERLEAEKKRRERYGELLQQGMQRLVKAVNDGNWAKVAAILARHQLMDGRFSYLAEQARWELTQKLAAELEIRLDWAKLQDANTETFEELIVLAPVEPQKLLLLAAGLLLSQDALAAARYNEHSPLLAFVLDEPLEAQPAFEGMDGNELDEDLDDVEISGIETSGFQTNDFPESHEANLVDEDEVLAAEHEAESEMLEAEREAALSE